MLALQVSFFGKEFTDVYVLMYIYMYIYIYVSTRRVNYFKVFGFGV